MSNNYSNSNSNNNITGYEIPIAEAVPINDSLPIVPNQSNRHNIALPKVPDSYNNAIPSQSTNTSILLENSIDIHNTKQYLSHFGWPTGLQNAAIQCFEKIPLRFFIIDDSGSMITNDGHIMQGNGNQCKFLPCSRWKELTQSMRFHVGLAKAARVSSEFRLLNGVPPIMIGGSNPDEDVGISTLNAVFDEDPRGATPLCKHIAEVVNQIVPIAALLRQRNQRAVVVIATDGVSSDGDIKASLLPLEKLPVLLVIRLCTDDPKIVEYWNTVDSTLELDMDVLDDFASEAEEIRSVNDWMVYGEPLHRFREFGSHKKELDVLDEAQLSVDQMMKTVSIILDIPVSEIPHPDINSNGFINLIEQKQLKLPKVYDPISKKMTHWINTRKLRQHYCRNNNCTIM